MRPAQLLSSTLLPLAAAVTFSCDDVVVKDHHFDLSPLKGPHTVTHMYEISPSVRNTTYAVDICGKLDTDPDLKADEQCPPGTWSGST